MKKIKNLLLIIAIVLGVPTSVYANSYTSLNLKETLTREKIEHDLSNYNETEDQITIYMFRGDRCAYCQSFLNFLNDNVNEYGKYFKLVSFEVWHNENNAALMGEVADHFGLTIKGVPFIIIGEKTFQGYTSSYDTEILETITNYYNNKTTYKDVVETFLVEKEESTTGAAITIIVVLAAIAGVGFLIYMAKEDSNVEEKKNEKEIPITLEEQEKQESKEKVMEKEANKSLERKAKNPTLPKLKEENKSTVNKKKEATTKTKTTVTSKSKTATPATLPKKKEEIKKETKTTNKTTGTTKKATAKKTTTPKTTKTTTETKKSSPATKKATNKTEATKKSTSKAKTIASTKKSATSQTAKKNKASN